MESYSPMITRVQAIASYDGPPVSGMLMFTKGDIATVMSKVSHDARITEYTEGGIWPVLLFPESYNHRFLAHGPNWLLILWCFMLYHYIDIYFQVGQC